MPGAGGFQTLPIKHHHSRGADPVILTRASRSIAPGTHSVAERFSGWWRCDHYIQRGAGASWPNSPTAVGAALVPSTVTGIVRRAGLLNAGIAPGQQAFRRFQRNAPDELWQMDFKGHFPLPSCARCHPLTVLDDHSLLLQACADERAETVRAALTATFRR